MTCTDKTQNTALNYPHKQPRAEIHITQLKYTGWLYKSCPSSF